jgi:hypothetical protein
VLAPPREETPMTRYQFECSMPELADGREIDIEDGGQAVIFHPTPEFEQGGDGFFHVRLQSWEDGAAKREESFAKAHSLMREFSGRRLRVTVETID